MVDERRKTPIFQLQVNTCDNILPLLQVVVEKSSYSSEASTHIMHVPKCSKRNYKYMDNIEIRTKT